MPISCKISLLSNMAAKIPKGIPQDPATRPASKQTGGDGLASSYYKHNNSRHEAPKIKHDKENEMLFNVVS